MWGLRLQACCLRLGLGVLLERSPWYQAMICLVPIWLCTNYSSPSLHTPLPASSCWTPYPKIQMLTASMDSTSEMARGKWITSWSITTRSLQQGGRSPGEPCTMMEVPRAPGRTHCLGRVCKWRWVRVSPTLTATKTTRGFAGRSMRGTWWRLAWNWNVMRM